MSQGTPNIARLVRQHAETSRLLGVDFVPVYRDQDSGESKPAESATAQQPAAVAAPEAAQRAEPALTTGAGPAATAPAVTRPARVEASVTELSRTAPTPLEEPGARTPIAESASENELKRSASARAQVEAKSSDAPKGRTSSRSKEQEVPPAAAPAAEALPQPSAEPAPATARPQASSVQRRPAGTAKDPIEHQRLLDELRARYEADAPHKNFVTSFTNIVFGEGDPCARLMFVGEAPGEEEDKTGRPFVGRAGQLLDKMIVAMGLRRQDVYIANVLKTRPPNNATPTLEESRLCAPYLYEQISIVDPEVIVTLGLPATRTLLGTMEAMGKLRGKWASFNPGGLAGGKTFAIMPTYHPAYLLRNYTPQERAKVWSDLQMAMERLGLAKQGTDPE